MQRKILSQRYSSIPDLAILLLVATTIYTVVSIADEWRTEFQPVTQINLSVWALPYYTLLSASRGLVAYLISLGFTLIVGYVAAKSAKAERVIIPLLDILQSIPVLGFLPGLLLGLVSLFPKTNTGLELAAIIMIFTGQVWNMTFSYYASLKSVPNDFKEASTVIGLNWYERLFKLELPFSAVNLSWNSLLSMAGGWFFLIPCEAITLGNKEYRLPGIGAYMDVAIKQNNKVAMSLAVLAMVLLIVLMDFVIWRPVLSWVQRFRLEEIAGISHVEPLMKIWIRESKIVLWLKVFYRTSIMRLRMRQVRKLSKKWDFIFFIQMMRRGFPKVYFFFSRLGQKKFHSSSYLQIGQALAWGFLFSLVGYGAFRLLIILAQVSIYTWLQLLKDTIWTFSRVIMALTIGTLWAVPFGIWIGTSQRRIRIAQPLIQVVASFPAPMLYPIALSLIFALGISFDWGAMLLMLLGVQWYVLFNVLAGALRIPQELNYAVSLMKTSRWDRWRVLYLPSVFPSLATGWITAAGGAWNASVVAEYISYQGGILKTSGLGAALSAATANEDFSLFAASLTMMVFVVVLMNRVVWSRIYHLAQTRYRMEI